MTTSVEATVHGELGAALAATPAGIVAVGIAIWMLVRPPKTLRVPTHAAILGLGAMWAFQLIRFGSSSL